MSVCNARGAIDAIYDHAVSVNVGGARIECRRSGISQCIRGSIGPSTRMTQHGTQEEIFSKRKRKN